jgi:DNA-binding response OmpR family regulator
MIVGMSANSSTALREEVLDVGMDAFIAKPFSIKELELILTSKMSERGVCT